MREEKEEDDKEKKEEEEKEEEMQGKRRDEEMQDSLVEEEGMMVNFPFFPLLLASFPWSSCFKVLSAKKKLNNFIVEMNKDSTSCILC